MYGVKYDEISLLLKGMYREKNGEEFINEVSRETIERLINRRTTLPYKAVKGKRGVDIYIVYNFSFKEKPFKLFFKQLGKDKFIYVGYKFYFNKELRVGEVNVTEDLNTLTTVLEKDFLRKKKALLKELNIKLKELEIEYSPIVDIYLLENGKDYYAVS